MLDIRFVKENPELVKENIRKKFKDAKLPIPLFQKLFIAHFLDSLNIQIKEVIENDYIKSYQIIEDKHPNGQIDKILITGLNVYKMIPSLQILTKLLLHDGSYFVHYIHALLLLHSCLHTYI